ncbi:MAG TPA: methyltransferase domain-containing protein [Tepidisphaeraceae bacterium]
MKSLASRQREEEWMDRPDVDPGELHQSLQFIRRVNRWLGYTRATISHLERFSARWKKGERITMIDFATGSGDVPVEILNWADRKGHHVKIVGVDLHAETSRAAREATGDVRLQVVRGDVLNLPFEEGSFDYAITSMFLHHLSEEEVVRVLSAMDRVSRRGIIAADLLRDRRAYNWACVFTAFSNSIVKHDARVSVRQAFNREEVLAMRDRAGVGYAKFHSHFGHRFVLAGERLSR